MNNWAIVVGIDKYLYQKKLRNAVADAKLISRTLAGEYGFERSRIISLYDGHATRSRILRLINDVVPRRWRVQTYDQLFFFFAGHGGRASKRGKKTWFLAPCDGRPVSASSENWETVLTGGDIRALETQFKGAHIFYVFDCCHAGMAFSYQAPVKRPARLRSVHALVAGRGGETVNDDSGTGHSVFTQSFAEALDGWGGLGNANDNSFIASDIIGFIRKDVPIQIRKKHLRPIQKPFGGPLGGNTEGREFKFTPVAPRLPANIVELFFHQHVETRRLAVRQIGELSESELGDVKRLALSRMARDSSPSVRTEVAVQLLPSLGRMALPLLIAMLTDEDDGVRLAVLSALPELRRHRAQIIPAVKEVQTHGSRRVKRAAQACLALLGVRRALSAVIEQLPTEEGSIRREIIDDLKKIPSTLVSKEILGTIVGAHLGDEDWRARRAAAEALGELGITSATSSLIRLAGSATQHFMVRYAAVEALGHIGQVSAREVIFRLLFGDRSLLVRTAAAEAVGSLGGVNASHFLARAMRADPEWRVRRSAVESCGLLGNRDASEHLIDTVDDPHFRVRMAVAQAMGEIGDNSTIGVLGKMAAKDQSRFVKKAAERALERF